MSAKSKSYKDGLYRRLRDNAEAMNYLQAALEDSQPAFLIALKNVLDARKVAAVARASNVSREHIYQMLTDEGNPTLNSLQKILHALGLRLTIGMGGNGTGTPNLSAAPRPGRQRHSRTAA